jgi:hypothetical protein
MCWRAAAPSQGVAPPQPPSLIERDPVRFWQGVCILLVIALLVSLATR